MKAGEFFVNLGVKGSEKTIQAFGQVKTGMADMASMSLEAKAGILGALYAFEKMMAASGAIGTSLTNFNALTGISARSLQEWQYAARQAGVSSEEMAGSIKSVQSSMTNMLLGNGAPAGFGLVASKVGFDMSRIRDTQYVLGQLQKFAQSVPPELATNVLKSFGLGEGVIAAMRRNMFRSDVFARAPTYSDRELKALDRANIAWSNLGTKIEMAFGHFNAAHGGQLVKEISDLTDHVLGLSNSLVTLSDRAHVFEVIGKSFEGWKQILDSINFTIESLTDNKKWEKIKDNLSYLPGFLSGGFLSGIFSPQPTPPNTPNSSSTQMTVNQNLNFQHDGKDAHKTANDVGRATKGAFRQIPPGQAN